MANPTAYGIDYAWGRPSIAALKGKSVVFVARYLAPLPNSKVIQKPEADGLLAGGIKVVLVWETAANRVLSGRAGGVNDAKAADAQVRALGMPGDPIYFACDFDALGGQIAVVMAYLDGVASVIGHGRTGLYGGLKVIKAAFDGGHAAYGWQTSAWSGGVWDSRAQLRQVAYNINVGGVECDNDLAYAPDYGQWPRPNAPKPPAPPAPVAQPVLRLGATGVAVKLLQRILNSRPIHPNLVVDGNFGPATLAAVKLVQKNNGLVVDGVVGPATWHVLGK